MSVRFRLLLIPAVACLSACQSIPDRTELETVHRPSMQMETISAVKPDVLPEEQWVKLNLEKSLQENAGKLAALNTAEMKEYRLGIGDVLNISLYGDTGDASTAADVPIDPAGNITYAITGTLHASGKTINELRTEMQQKVDQQLNYAIINVVPAKLGSQTYTILGMLNTPGVYQLSGNKRLLDAIATAKGLLTGQYRNTTIELADLPHSTLVRNNQLMPIDFEKLILKGDGRYNIPLHNGDIISIPSALENHLYILGEVNNPRMMEYYSSSVNLLQVLTEAQGLKSYTADGRVIVVRGKLNAPAVYTVNVKKMLAGKAKNVLLKPGDIIYAPPKKFEFGRDVALLAVRSFALSAATRAGQNAYEDADPLGTGHQSENNLIINP